MDTTSPTALAWGAAIKQRREERELTRTDLASQLDVSRQTVSFWEAGRYAPSADMQPRVVAALDLDVTAIYAAMQGDAPVVPS